ncbi:hypothetical protein [Shinella sp.]|uniref:hypothetical protein n=1 Tax=Shinella sp. TaxID=1870904 RepID=UPI004035AA64
MFNALVGFALLGFVAPLFGTLFLVDLIIFWMNACTYRELVEISFLTAFAVALVALLYYFATTQVFRRSRRPAPWSTISWGIGVKCPCAFWRGI